MDPSARKLDVGRPESLKINDTHTAESQIKDQFPIKRYKALVVNGTILRPVTSDISETVPAVKVFNNQIKFTQGTRDFISTTNRTICLNIWAGKLSYLQF